MLLFWFKIRSTVHGATSLTTLFMLSVMYLYVPTHPIPTPARSGLHLPVTKCVIEDLNELNLFQISLLLLISFLLLVTSSKLSTIFLSKFRFVPFDVNLNVLKKNDLNTTTMLWYSLTYDLIVLHLLLPCLLLYDIHLLILLPNECISIDLFANKSVIIGSICTTTVHVILFELISFSVKIIARVFLIYSSCTNFCPYEIIAL